MFTGCTVTRDGALMGYGAKFRTTLVISAAAACAAAGTVRMPGVRGAKRRRRQTDPSDRGEWNHDGADGRAEVKGGDYFRAVITKTIMLHQARTKLARA